ncbi:MAG: hypothetical protein CMO55_02010 [Verrucomicrobiales bacterium]|nr:hypothetical protein [Verrucomicrobiales bacterium]
MGAQLNLPIELKLFPFCRIFAISIVAAISTAFVLPSYSHDPLARQISTGEWGTIESYEVVLEPPSEQLWESLYSERSVWNFASLTQEEVFQLFNELSFSEELIDLIRAEGVWIPTVNGLDLEITDQIVEAVPSQTRSALARWFRVNNNKYFRNNVSNVEGHNLEILRSRLTPEQMELVEKVAFKRGSVISILDRPYLLRNMGDNDQAKRDLVRSLFSTHSLIVKLRISENSDIDALTKYWSGNGKNPRVRAILEGVKATKGVDSVDIIQLLPPVPRKYMFGFARVQDVFPQNAPDCFWTSVQFFRSVTSPRLLDSLSMNHYLDGQFDLVYGDPTFGDMVCLFRADDDQFVHSYIHIADDIVFSKNGSSFTRPWILIRKDRMMSVYIDEDAMIPRVFREKN